MFCKYHVIVNGMFLFKNKLVHNLEKLVTFLKINGNDLYICNYLIQVVSNYQIKDVQI